MNLQLVSSVLVNAKKLLMVYVTLVLNAAFITVTHALTTADSIAQNAEKD